MNTYYNEFDANAAKWIRNLGADGQISQGVVDERSIKCVTGAELAGIRRAHFFAGIGGWDLALRLAGWDDSEVWTGSCPCQPYSSAGKQEGDADPRNLWPDFFRLIRERRPGTIFGEQVASAIKHGWLDRVFADLEGIGYTCGAAVLGAHSVGANHIRQRLYWGAALGSPDAERGRHHEHQRDGCGVGGAEQKGEGSESESRRTSQKAGDRGAAGGVPDSESGGQRIVGGASFEGGQRHADGSGAPGRISEHERGGCDWGQSSAGRNIIDGTETGRKESTDWPTNHRAVRSSWSDFRYIFCTDGKARRVGSRVFPLAYGIPRGVGECSTWRKGLARGASRARTGMLKGSGNAIVPELAAEFIRAFRESRQENI